MGESVHLVEKARYSRKIAGEKSYYVSSVNKEEILSYNTPNK